MWDKEPVKTGGGMCIERLRVWMIGSKVHIVLELIEWSGGYIVDSAPSLFGKCQDRPTLICEWSVAARVN